MKQKLERQADQIENLLTIHGCPGHVSGGTVTPTWVRFQVFPTLGTRVSTIKGLDKEMAAALGTPSVEITRRGAAVSVEVPRDDPQQVQLLPLLKQLNYDHHSIPPVTAILGLAEDGAPLLVRLPSPDVGHVLIAGITGAGKTALLRTMLLSVAMTNASGDLAFVFMGDGLPDTMNRIEQLGFSVHRITTMRQAIAAFNVYGKRVIMISDDVVGNGNNVASTLGRLMRVSDKIHYLLAWDGMPPSGIGDLFKVRLVGRMSNAEDARTATGIVGTGAERLTGRGDFLAVAEGRVMRFQAAFLGDSEPMARIRA